MHLKYFIIAGESSGDLHGSLLMKHMQELDPNVQFEGIGGNPVSYTHLTLPTTPYV